MTMTKINDNGIDRDMTSEEKTAHKAWQVIAQKEAENIQDAAVAKLATRQAVLDKLGLTQDEANALFG